MKSLIFVLIVISLLQSTIIPLDLVLIILICRSYLRVSPDKDNLYLAFAFGIFNSFLNLTPIGVQSLIYLGLVTITEGLSKSRLAGNPLMVVPLSFVLVSLNQIVLSFTTNQSLQLFPKNLLLAILSLPILYLVRLWEERFIVRQGIKLRI